MERTNKTTNAAETIRAERAAQLAAGTHEVIETTYQGEDNEERAVDFRKRVTALNKQARASGKREVFATYRTDEHGTTHADICAAVEDNRPADQVEAAKVARVERMKAAIEAGKTYRETMSAEGATDAEITRLEKLGEVYADSNATAGTIKAAERRADGIFAAIDARAISSAPAERASAQPTAPAILSDTLDTFGLNGATPEAMRTKAADIEALARNEQSAHHAHDMKVDARRIREAADQIEANSAADSIVNDILKEEAERDTAGKTTQEIRVMYHAAAARAQHIGVPEGAGSYADALKEIHDRRAEEELQQRQAAKPEPMSAAQIMTAALQHFKTSTEPYPIPTGHGKEVIHELQKARGCRVYFTIECFMLTVTDRRAFITETGKARIEEEYASRRERISDAAQRAMNAANQTQQITAGSNATNHDDARRMTGHIAQQLGFLRANMNEFPHTEADAINAEREADRAEDIERETREGIEANAAAIKRALSPERRAELVKQSKERRTELIDTDRAAFHAECCYTRALEMGYSEETAEAARSARAAQDTAIAAHHARNTGAITEDDEQQAQEQAETAFNRWHELRNADDRASAAAQPISGERASAPQPEDDTQPVYEVIAGNVGSVYSGPDEARARQDYNDLIEASQAPSGRVSGERVELRKDGEPIEEYEPPRDENAERVQAVQDAADDASRTAANIADAARIVGTPEAEQISASAQQVVLELSRAVRYVQETGASPADVDHAQAKAAALHQTLSNISAPIKAALEIKEHQKRARNASNEAQQYAIHADVNSGRVHDAQAPASILKCADEDAKEAKAAAAIAKDSSERAQVADTPEEASQYAARAIQKADEAREIAYRSRQRSEDAEARREEIEDRISQECSEQHDQPNNASRAAAARAALDAHSHHRGDASEPLETRISDLITNLYHLMNQEGDAPSEDHARNQIDEIAYRSRNHYDTERTSSE